MPKHKSSLIIVDSKSRHYFITHTFYILIIYPCWLNRYILSSTWVHTHMHKNQYAHTEADTDTLTRLERISTLQLTITKHYSLITKIYNSLTRLERISTLQLTITKHYGLITKIYKSLTRLERISTLQLTITKHYGLITKIYKFAEFYR